MGEMGCYDDKTEVLTESGWKPSGDLGVDEETHMLNWVTDTTDYRGPEALAQGFSHNTHMRK